ncbi:hypothetical protein F5Y10DRAFT_287702 [Nemania abortiva]|nr:hypothetical protein F5Y10DRAFT_287702 [Nemania abortiva]
MIAAIVTRNIATVTITQPPATLVVLAPNTTAIGTRFQNSLEVRLVTTIVSSLAFILAGVTYWMLLKHSALLSSQCAIPIKYLEENIARVLNFAWPKASEDRKNRRHLPLTLLAENRQLELRLYAKVGALSHTAESPCLDDYPVEEWDISFDERGRCWHTFKHGARELLGYSEVPTERAIDFHPRSLLLPTASPVLKSIIQASVWEWVGVWLVSFVTINTLFFNGFTTEDNTPDMWLRLALVLIYGVAVVIHAYHMCAKIYQILTYVVFQATWTIIMSNFIFGIEGQDPLYFDQILLHIPQVLRNRSNPYSVFHTFQGILMGEITVKRMYRNIFLESHPRVIAVPIHRIGSHTSGTEFLWPKKESPDRTDPKIPTVKSGALFFREFDSVKSAFTNQIKPLMDSEIKTFEKAAELGLERIMANIVILLGICLATGLASLTNVPSIDATSAQIGSYALLLSVSSGLLALISSASHINTAARSARTLLNLQEHVLSMSWEEHLSGKTDWKQQEVPKFGLHKSQTEQLRGYGVTMKRLLQILTPKQCLQSIIFGFTLPFLPTGEIVSELSMTSKPGITISFNDRAISTKQQSGNFENPNGDSNSSPTATIPVTAASTTPWPTVTVDTLLSILEEDRLNLTGADDVIAWMKNGGDCDTIGPKFRAAQISGADKFSTWFESLDSHQLLVQGYPTQDVEEVQLREAAPALSCLSAFMSLTKLDVHQNVIALVFFCEQQRRSHDTLAGPAAMIRNLTVQLLQAYFTNFTFREQDIDTQRLQAGDINAFCSLFGFLVKQVAPQKTIFCVIDGVGEYETNEHKDDLRMVLDCILDLTRVEDVPPTLKVLVTCHTGTVEVHNSFNGDAASSLSLEELAPNEPGMHGHVNMWRAFSQAIPEI